MVVDASLVTSIIDDTKDDNVKKDVSNVDVEEELEEDFVVEVMRCV